MFAILCHPLNILCLQCLFTSVKMVFAVNCSINKYIFLPSSRYIMSQKCRVSRNLNDLFTECLELVLDVGLAKNRPHYRVWPKTRPGPRKHGRLGLKSGPAGRSRSRVIIDTPKTPEGLLRLRIPGSIFYPNSPLPIIVN